MEKRGSSAQTDQGELKGASDTKRDTTKGETGRENRRAHDQDKTTARKGGKKAREPHRPVHKTEPRKVEQRGRDRVSDRNGGSAGAQRKGSKSYKGSSYKSPKGYPRREGNAGNSRNVSNERRGSENKSETNTVSSFGADQESAASFMKSETSSLGSGGDRQFEKKFKGKGKYGKRAPNKGEGVADGRTNPGRRGESAGGLRDPHVKGAHQPAKNQTNYQKKGRGKPLRFVKANYRNSDADVPVKHGHGAVKWERVHPEEESELKTPQKKVEKGKISEKLAPEGKYPATNQKEQAAKSTLESVDPKPEQQGKQSQDTARPNKAFPVTVDGVTAQVSLLDSETGAWPLSEINEEKRRIPANGEHQTEETEKNLYKTLPNLRAANKALDVSGLIFSIWQPATPDYNGLPDVCPPVGRVPFAVKQNPATGEYVIVYLQFAAPNVEHLGLWPRNRRPSATNPGFPISGMFPDIYCSDMEGLARQISIARWCRRL